MPKAFRRMRLTGSSSWVAICSVAAAVALACSGLSAARHLKGALAGQDEQQPVVVWERDLISVEERRTLSAANAADVLMSDVFADAGFVFVLATTEVLLVGDVSHAVRVASISDNAFEILGKVPALGRALQKGDASSSDPVAVISWALWRRLSGSTAAVLGTRIELPERSAATIIGVMPPHEAFPYPVLDSPPDIWVPAPVPRGTLARRYNGYVVFGRMLPDSGLEQANAGLAVVSERLQAEFPETNRGVRFYAEPLAEASLARYMNGLGLVIGVSVLVMLLAGANLLNAVFSDRLARSQIIAMKRALGASTLHLWREEAARALIVAGVGTLLGMSVTAWLLRSELVTLGLLGSTGEPIPIDWAASGVAVAVAWTTCMLTTLPVLSDRSTRHLSDVSGGRVAPQIRFAQDGQVALQVGAAVAILALAVSTVMAYHMVLVADRGRQTAGLLATSIALPNVGYQAPALRLRFLSRVSDELSRLPGILAVGVLDKVKVLDVGQVAVRGSGEQGVLTDVFLASENLSEALGLNVLHGMWLSPTRPEMRQVVINEAMARELGGTGMALNQLLSIPNRGREPYTVVGIVADVDHFNPHRWRHPQVYLSFEQRPQNLFTLLTRTGDSRMSQANAVSKVIRDVEPQAFIREQYTFNDQEAQIAWPARAQLNLLSGLAVMLVALALVGSVGVAIARTRARAKELAIRHVLGASRVDLLLRMSGRVMVFVIGGGVAGCLLSLAGGRAIESLVYGYARVSPIVALICALVVVLVTAVATMVMGLRHRLAWQALIRM